MTTIDSKVIADSINEYGNRITTFQLRYPRWIHAEGRTHRHLRVGEDEFDITDLHDWEQRTPSFMEDPTLSRNASSSRAIPVERLIQDVLDDPAVPMFWGANQRGMQAGAQCNESVYLLSPNLDDFNAEIDHGTSWDYNFYGDGYNLEKEVDEGEGSDYTLYAHELSREDAWREAMYRMIDVARGFDKAGYHKQIINRLLEPFSHINVVCTATEWTNFYGLRRHDAAEPHIHLLADRMFESQQASTPRLLKRGEWHLPYVSDEQLETYGLTAAKKLSVACCASVSYKTVDGDPMTPERALSLHDKLVSAHPLHASPAEHQATPDRALSWNTGVDVIWDSPKLHGNLVGFVQYRKTLPNECIA